MAFRSRWGYHPCNYETYRKLRKLHKAYWEGRRLLAKWHRWKAKRPHNRTRPEPVVPDVVKQVCASSIVHEFQSARHPVAEPEQVRKLGIKLDQIDAWIAQLDALAVP